MCVLFDSFLVCVCVFFVGIVFLCVLCGLVRFVRVCFFCLIHVFVCVLFDSCVACKCFGLALFFGGAVFV